jgi:hypothetical protein
MPNNDVRWEIVRREQSAEAALGFMSTMLPGIEHISIGLFASTAATLSRIHSVKQENRAALASAINGNAVGRLFSRTRGV